MTIRTYRQLKRLKTFEERFDYLSLKGVVGETTFGFDRYINQMLYNSDRWKKIREKVIIRDNACDLGVEDFEIYDIIIVHHIDPITLEDIERERAIVYDLDNLICTSKQSHLAIHYGDISKIPRMPIERNRNDTCPWR